VQTPRLPTPRTENDDGRKQMTVPAEGDRKVIIKEAAASAARAVAEAEIAKAEAEEAIRLAEKIESDAQVTQAFVETVILHLKNRNPAPLVSHFC
jgi:transcription factor MYB, plant